MLTADQFFYTLANPLRLRLLLLLLAEDELCVCELTQAVGESQPKVSRHLAVLREAGILLDRRQGLWIFYRLNQQLPSWILSLLHTTHAGVASQPPYSNDLRALRRIATPTNRLDCSAPQPPPGPNATSS